MTGSEFERAVRQLARARWNLPYGDGAAEFINQDEIDCVCRTEDVTHLIECTTERRLEKFRTQINKLEIARRRLEERGETVALWIVTKHDPTPEQRTQAKGARIRALSLEEFQRQLVDAGQYLEARWQYRFGSANDPEEGGHRLSDNEYVTQPLTRSGFSDEYSVSDLCSLLIGGKAIVLSGPFGAGKSLTLREVFKQLRGDYYRNPTNKIPIAINLSDHWGQGSVDEILRRHAERVGFEKPHELVRAWNAGLLLPLLDGIDELASPVFAMDKDAISRSRQEALKVIQAFMRDIRGTSGVLLTGRDHYFDSVVHARALMHLPEDAIFVDVGEFYESQAMEYLKNKGITADLPTWLPRKPLLLGYLASRELLNQVSSIDGDGGPALAWHHFLDRICEREADLFQDVQSDTVRLLLENLAVRARSLPRGSGPLYDSDLTSAYKEITKVEPSVAARTLLQRLPGLTARDQEEGARSFVTSAYKEITKVEPSVAARTLLQRLPGLTARDQEEGARSFVDDDMMEALRAGSVARFIIDPHTSVSVNKLAHPLNAFGCSVTGYLGDLYGLAAAQYTVAAIQALQRWEEPTLALDVILSGSAAPNVEMLDAQGLTITRGLADEIDMEDRPIVNLTLDTCLIQKVRFDSSESAIEFRKCAILRIEGIANERALPASVFAECEVEAFDNRHTNTAILGSDLPTSIKVLLVLVRKLFLQRGSGRAESALYRGIDGPLRGQVSPVLDLLTAEGIVYSHNANRRIIWHGNRTHRTRMLKILEGDTNADDSLMKAVARVTSS